MGFGLDPDLMKSQYFFLFNTGGPVNENHYSIHGFMINNKQTSYNHGISENTVIIEIFNFIYNLTLFLVFTQKSKKIGLHLKIGNYLKIKVMTFIQPRVIPRDVENVYSTKFYLIGCI